MTTKDGMPSTYFSRACARLVAAAGRTVASANRTSLRELNAPLTRRLISAR